MADDTALTTLRCWFGEVQYGSLALPDGWFGPPQESRHQLTWSELDGRRLVVELDGALKLVFDDARTVATVEGSLLFKDFESLVFECSGWRGIRAEERRYDGGIVTLTPPVGVLHPREFGVPLGKRRPVSADW